MLLSVKNISISFPIKAETFSIFNLFKKEKKLVVKNVSFDIEAGETIGVVGESGCGKTTLGRSIIRLQNIDSGEIFCEGEDISKWELTNCPLKIRRKIQMVFQNPYASLNPRQTVFEILSEPLKIHFPNMSKYERIKRIDELMDSVELSHNFLQRFPHEFSGGQRQRIAIARAISVEPKLIICDEPTSALDVSVQSKIVQLFKKIQRQTNVAYLFIAHDLALVETISDKVLVMNKGEIVESGSPDEVYHSPKTNYTKKLLAAVPRI